ncbi:MAG TPA: ROK family protein [Chloroflexi bacterium]|nr:ROK family protein [Chloroflexota bacterium]
MDKPIAALDLGGTQIRTALYDREGNLLARYACPTSAYEGRDAVIARIIKALEEVAKGENLAAIGVGAPGPLDPWEGVIFSAPNLPGWENVPLKRILSERFGVPVFVGNDANVAALAEHRLGAGAGFPNIIYITVSTGIGGGIIVDNRLLLGARGLAGEVGHIVVEPEGPVCNCGNRGCMEAMAAGPAIAREAVRRIREGEESLILEMVNGDVGAITAREVALAAQQGDELAVEVFRLAGYYIGIGIVSLMHLFNPSRIIIGGSVAKAGPVLFGPIEETVESRVMEEFLKGFAVVPASLGDDVGLLGAFVLARDEIAPEHGA